MEQGQSRAKTRLAQTGTEFWARLGQEQEPDQEQAGSLESVTLQNSRRVADQVVLLHRLTCSSGRVVKYLSLWVI